MNPNRKAVAVVSKEVCLKIEEKKGTLGSFALFFKYLGIWFKISQLKKSEIKYKI